MFSNLTISILLGLGIGTWIGNKVHKSSGKNFQSSLLVGGIFGLLIIIAGTIILDMVFKHK
jgi:hypothetical protein